MYKRSLFQQYFFCHLALPLLLFSCMMVHPCFAQELTKLRYAQGAIRGQLPYGERFLIQGETILFNREKADVVSMKIYEGRAKGNKKDPQIEWIPQPYTTSTWWRTQVDKKEFTLYVGKPLNFNTYYKVDIKFYNLFQFNLQQREQLVTRVINRINGRFNEIKTVNVNEVETNIVKEAINTEALMLQSGAAVSTSPGGNKREFFFLSREQDIVQEGNPIDRDIFISDEFLAPGIAQYVVRKNQLNEINTALGDRITEIKDFAKKGPNQIDYAQLLEYLRNNTEILPEGGDEIVRMQNFTASGDTPADLLFVPDLLLRINKVAEGDLRDKLINTLLNLRQLYNRQLEDSRRAKEMTAEVSVLKDSIFSEIKPLIIQAFAEVGAAETIEAVTIQDRTGLLKVRVGTTLGGALIAYNAGGIDDSGTRTFLGEADFDMLGYAGIKFYFKPVDKGLLNPYLSGNGIISRSSFLIGFAIAGDSKYKGQQLSNVAGVRPLLGFSHDLNPIIAIDAGAFLFRQPSLIPSVNSNQTLKAAPFISLSFDLDLINRLNSTFSNQPYRQLNFIK